MPQITLVGNGRRGKIITKLLHELGHSVDYTIDLLEKYRQIE